MKISWSKAKNIIFVLFYLVLMLLPLGKLLPENVDEETYKNSLIFLNAGIDGLLFILGVIFFFATLKTDYKKMNQAFSKILGYIGIFFVLCYAGNIVGSIITTTLGGAGNSANQNVIESLLTSQYRWLLIVILVIIGPIVEEMVFRQALTSFLKDIKIPKAIVWVIVACLFGLIHVYSAGDYIMVFPYIGMGLALGAAVIWSDNIYTSIIVHILINGIATLMMFLL